MRDFWGEWIDQPVAPGRYGLGYFGPVFSLEAYASLKESFSTLVWEKKEDQFYSHAKSVLHPEMEHPLASFFDAEVFSPIESLVLRYGGEKIAKGLYVVAHKMGDSDAIGVHNDYAPEEFLCEHYRLIFQFGGKGSGGVLSFLHSRYSDDVRAIFPVAENRGIFFAISRSSFHSVSPVEGERYSVVIYLWKEGAPTPDRFHPLGLERRRSLSW